MTHEDKEKLIEVLTGIHDFYGRDMSAFAVAVWAQACETFDAEQVTKALSAHLMDAERGQFMPKPSDVVRQLQGTHTDRALIAWGKVLDALRRVGAYTDVAFDDGLIHAAIEDIGGWIKLCRSGTDELGYTQKRFCDLYRAYAGRGDVNYPAMLRGEHSLNNFARGFPVAPPVLIGNPDRAARVLKLGSNQPKTQITNAADFVQGLKRLGDHA
jgi:hypothetical protein